MSSQMLIESQESLNHDLFERWVDHVALSLDSISVYRYMWISIMRAAGQLDILSMGLNELEALVYQSAEGKSVIYRRRLAQLLSRVVQQSSDLASAKELPSLFPDEKKRSAPAVLAEQQADQLFKLDRVNEGDWKALRDIAMVAVALGAGVKLHELINIRRSDVIHGLHGVDFKIRGARSRAAPMSEKAVPYLDRWITFVDEVRSDIKNSVELPLFMATLSDNGVSERMSKATAYRAFRAMLSKAGIEQGASSRLRHTFGQNQIDQGIEAKVVAEWMGLHNQDTISRYQRPKRPN